MLGESLRPNCDDDVTSRSADGGGQILDSWATGVEHGHGHHPRHPQVPRPRRLPQRARHDIHHDARRLVRDRPVWRPKLALFVNATTLLPVFMPLAPAATVLERFPDTLAVVLRAHGTADCIIDRELAETAEQRLAKTSNRSVVGVMNEFARLADWRRDEITGPRRPDVAGWHNHRLSRKASSGSGGR